MTKRKFLWIEDKHTLKSKVFGNLKIYLKILKIVNLDVNVLHLTSTLYLLGVGNPCNILSKLKSLFVSSGSIELQRISSTCADGYVLLHIIHFNVLFSSTSFNKTQFSIKIDG